jgi:hypothetical protein
MRIDELGSGCSSASLLADHIKAVLTLVLDEDRCRWGCRIKIQESSDGNSVERTFITQYMIRMRKKNNQRVLMQMFCTAHIVFILKVLSKESD